MTSLRESSEQCYSAAAPRPGFFANGLAGFDYPARAIRRHVLVWNFFRRQLLGRFRGSALGILWVLIHPIFLFAVYFLVFGLLFGRHALSGTGPSIDFALYLFAGISLFSAMTEATTGGLSAVVSNGNLVKKVAFPCELLPLTNVLVAGLVYCVGSAVLVAAGALGGGIELGWWTLCWPLVVVVFVVFSTGLGLLLANAFVFSRDLQHLYAIVAQAWFFLTPVFWDVGLVRGRAGYEWAIDWMPLNPMYCLVMANRQIFGIGNGLPDYEHFFPLTLGQNLGIAAGWALVMFFLGHATFVGNKHKYADLV